MPRPADLVAAIRAHPAFPEAMRGSAEAIVADHDRNRLLNRLISDRGRALFGILAVALHFDSEGGGLTVSRIGELCDEMDVCSRGRVRAMLLLLRWAGHVVPVAGAGDRRRRPLAPTERMLAAYRGRWRRQLELIAPMSPEAAAVAAGLDRPEVLAAYAVALGATLRSGFRLLDHGPALSTVAERDNGLLLLLRLAFPGAADDASTRTVAELAAAARVSRSHVLNLLREAEAAGLVQRNAGTGPAATITCRPLLSESLAGFFAATYAAMTAAAIAVETGAARTLPKSSACD